MLIARALGAALAVIAATALAQNPELTAEDPQALIAKVEQRVLAAKKVSIEADVQVSGAQAARLRGRVDFGERNTAKGNWQGELRGAPLALDLKCDRMACTYGGRGTPQLEATGRAANRAWLSSAVRTGLWPELARLEANEAPLHAEDWLEDWAKFEAARPTTYATSMEMRGTMSTGFDIVIEGAEAGSMRLWLDPETGMPKRRTWTRKLPEGEVTVTEDYIRFAIE